MTPPDIAAPQAGTDRFSVLALTTPVAMGYIPLGTVFGVYALWVLLNKRSEALFGD